MAADILKTLLVNTVVFSALFGIMLLIRRAFAYRISAVLRYILWVVVVIKLIIPFGFESALSPFGWITYPAAQTETLTAPQKTPAVQNAVPQDTTGIQVNSAVDTPPVNTTYQQVQATENVVNISLDWTEWVLIIWLTGALGMALWLGFSMRHLQRRIRHAQTDVPEHIAAAFDACREELGIRRRIRIQMQSAVAVPFITGMLKPALILPDSICARNENDLKHVFTHELIHYKHGDLAAIQAMNALNCIYWFNPLMWLCFSMIRSDIETICDQRCLRLAAQDSHGYVETVLGFAGLTVENRRLHAAMSLNDGRSCMEKRIRDMFRTRKSGRRTRMLAGLIAALMLVVCIMTACQPTPKEEIIVNKKNNEDNIVSSTTRPSTETTERLKYNFPENWKDSFSYYDGKLTINVDAELDAPNVDVWPAYSVEMANYTQEEVNQYVNALCGGTTLYYASRPKTKAEYEQEIINYKLAISQIKNGMYNGDDSIENINQDIEIAQKLMETAPETVTTNQIATSQMQFSSDFNGYILYVNADLGRNSKAVIDIKSILKLPDIYNAIRFINTDSGNYYNIFGGSDEPNPITNLTLDEAKVKAAKLIQDMGIEGYAYAASKIGQIEMAEDANKENVDKCYLIFYTKVYNGLPSIYEDVQSANDPTSSREQTYVPSVYYDRITIAVDNQGIANFVWLGKEQQTGVLNENASLLSFDQIKKSFEQLMKVKYAHVDDDKDSTDSVMVDITRITLGYMRVQRAGSSGEYMAVPVWDFYDSGYHSILTINAIDGSIIDRGVGY